MQLVISGSDNKIAALEKELRFRAKIFGFKMELIDDSEPEEELEDEEPEANDQSFQQKSAPAKTRKIAKKAGRPPKRK